MVRLIDRLRDQQGRAKLVGEAPAFHEAIEHLPNVAKSDATLLLSGETGTGKELAARAIHYLSPRAAFPFIPVNCGSMPDSLLEVELFGHERGAFTDARAPRPGLIAQADGGTLFLDELETLSAKAQVTLLRVLQDKRFRPVGSCSERQADIRFVAATNAPLDKLVKTGTFRADLYYRLNVFTVRLPPLRDRKEDIPILARHFLRKHSPTDRDNLRLSPEALEGIIAYDWPGNVRELENAIIRGIHICQSLTIELGELGVPSPGSETPVDALPTASFGAMKKKVIEAFERDYLIRLMSRHRGNVSHAAQAAGKERRDLGKLLKRHQIDPKQFRVGSPPPDSP